jgi:DsbC/DsbD-like thiol-disulfide interchange protein
VRERNSSSDFLRPLLGAAVLLFAACTQAATTPIPHGTLELIAENQWIAPGHTLNVGLHFQLEKGWHVYWVNPGDSGEPPRLTWHLPPGIAVGPMEWPTPRRLGTATIADFGYEDAVTLIVPVHAAASLPAKQPAQLAADVKVLVCREMCIPGKAQISLTLPIKSQPSPPDSRTSELFAAARKSLPQQAPRNWKFSLTDTKDSFVLSANIGRQITQAVFFPLAESQIDNAGQQKLAPTSAGFQLELRKSDQLLKPIERLKGVLVLAADQSFSIDVPLTKSNAAKNAEDVEIQLAQYASNLYRTLKEEPQK